MNRKSGRHCGRRSIKQVLVLALAFVLVIGASVGGTLAWLTAKTGTVTNTFTSAELFANPKTDFTLWEFGVEDEDEDGRLTLTETRDDDGKIEYSILPGVDIPKKPMVTITGLQENAYLFITVSDSLAEKMTWSMDKTYWKPLGSSYPGVYVYVDDPEAEITADNCTIVPGTYEFNVMTQTDGTAIEVDENYTAPDADPVPQISLTFTAYMTQATGQSDVATAWATNFGTNG